MAAITPVASRQDWRLEINAGLWAGAAAGIYLYAGLLESGFLSNIPGNIWVLALFESPFVITAAIRGPAGCAPAQWSSYSPTARCFTLSASALLFVAIITVFVGIAETDGSPGSVAAYLVPSAMFVGFAILMCYGGQRRPAAGAPFPMIAQPDFYPPPQQYVQRPVYAVPQQRLLL